jgi:hypothetical protein
LAFGTATFEPEAYENITIDAEVTNLGDRTAQFSVDAMLSFGDLHATATAFGQPVPAGGRTDVRYGFHVDPFDGNLANGVLTFGDGREAGVTVPLGAGTADTYEPHDIASPGTVVNGSYTYDFTRCLISADIAPEHVQAPAGHLVLTCWADITWHVKSIYQRWVAQENYRLKTRDANIVAPAAASYQNMSPDVAYPNMYAAFVIKAPVSGTYVLELTNTSALDPDYGKTMDVTLTV